MMNTHQKSLLVATILIGTISTSYAINTPGVVVNGDATSNSDAIVFGRNAKLIGPFTNQENTAVVIGTGATVQNTPTPQGAIGTNGSVIDYKHWALTTGSANYHYPAIALGHNSAVYGIGGMAMGEMSSASNGGLSLGGATYSDNASFALGFQAYATASTTQSSTLGGAIALGTNVYADGYSSFASGYNTRTYGDRNIAMGSGAAVGTFVWDTNTKNWVATGQTTQSIAMGDMTIVTGAASIGMGPNTQILNSSSIGIGNTNIVNSANSSTVGSRNTLSGTGSLFVGGNSNQVTGSNSNVIGSSNILPTGSINTSIMGYNNKLTPAGINSVILGNNNAPSNASSVYVLGSNVTKTTASSVFLGNFTEYTDPGATTVGKTKAYTQQAINGFTYNYAGGAENFGVVSVGNPTQTRRIQNMSPGLISATSTDGVNGSQLYAVGSVLGNLANTTAAGIGGGTTVNPDGTLNIQLTVGGNTFTTIQDALNAMPSTGGTAPGPVGPVNPNSVAYDDGNHNTVTLTGPNGTTITNLAPGSIAPNSTDAINGGQLYNTTRTLTRDINNSGALGAALAGLHPIQYDPQDRNQIMAAIGHYKNSNALALGWAHYTNEDTMIHAGVALGSGEHMFNFGATWKWGEDKQPKGIAKIYGGDPITSVYTLERQMVEKNTEITTLQAQMKTKDEQISKLQEQVAYLMTKVK